MSGATDATKGQAVERGRLHEPGAARETDPGLVLIPDVWGPSEHSADLGADLAREGFRVLELDLYRGLRLEPGFEIEAPGPFIRRLDDADILADVESAGQWFSDEVLGGRPPGVIGVCMGGTYTFLTACRSNVYVAAAPFYGILSYDDGLIGGDVVRDRTKKPKSPIEAAPELRMPLLAHFGGADAFVPSADRERLEAGLRASGETYRIEVADGAGHAFLNRTRPESYHPEAARSAWSEAIPFLKQALSH